jgi:hypothetical protein
MHTIKKIFIKMDINNDAPALLSDKHIEDIKQLVKLITSLTQLAIVCIT